MENKTKISFLIPTYINHFKYVKNFINSFKYCSDIDDIDINIIVSNENEQKQLNQIIEEETKIYNINIIDFNIIFNTIFETSYNDNEIIQEIANNLEKKHLQRFFYQSLKKILFAYYNSNYDIYYIIDSESMFIENINIHNYVENFLRTKQCIYNNKKRVNNDSYRFFNKFFYSKSKLNSTSLCTYNWVFEKKILLDFLSEFVKIIKLNDFKTLLSGYETIFIENCYYYYIHANNEKYNYNFIDITVNSDISNIQDKISYEFMEDIRKYITNDKEIQFASNIFLDNNIQIYKPNEDYNENDIKFMKSAKIKLLVSGVSSKLYNRIEMESILKQKVRNFKIFENTIINNSLIPLNQDKVYLYSLLDRSKNESVDNIDNYIKNDVENMKELDNNNYYFVIENTWNTNFHHCLNETVLLIDIYMKYLNEFPNIKMLIKKKKSSNFYQKFIDMLPETKITFVDDEKLIKGNFVYILPYCYTDKNDEKVKETYSFHNRPMILDIINKANEKYSDCNKIKKIYISRRNIFNKSWNNRYLTNIEEVSNIIIKQGYKEIFTDELEDFLYQVYLINNVDEIILELGAGCDNIVFMKENSIMTIIGNNTKESHLWVERFYIYNNKVKIQEKLFGETDKTSKYYSDNIVNKYNLPYRFNENFLINITAYNYNCKSINNLDDIQEDTNNFYNYKGLNFLSKMNSNNKNLVIIFHGAIPNNGTNRIIFRGYDYEIDNTNIICICDYLLNKYEEYKVNWTLSTNKYNIEYIYEELFTYIINKQKYNKVIFTGTSAGGFPSLKFASKFNCIALISNSQIYLEKYGTEVNKQGFYHLKYMVESKEDKLIYEDKMIESIIQNNKPNKIIIYNNKKDSTYETHVLPLINYAKNIEIYDLFETYFFEYNNLTEETNQHGLQFPNDKKHIDILQEYLKNN